MFYPASLALSHQAIADLIKRSKIQSFTIGDRVFVLRSEVEKFRPGKPGPPKGQKRKKPSAKAGGKKGARSKRG